MTVMWTAKGLKQYLENKNKDFGYFSDNNYTDAKVKEKGLKKIQKPFTET
jgi:hypothetical protein